MSWALHTAVPAASFQCDRGAGMIPPTAAMHSAQKWVRWTFFGRSHIGSRWMSTFIWRMRCFTLEFLRSHDPLLAVRFFTYRSWALCPSVVRSSGSGTIVLENLVGHHYFTVPSLAWISFQPCSAARRTVNLYHLIHGPVKLCLKEKKCINWMKLISRF